MKIELFYGEELNQIPEDKMVKLANCYKNIFNTFWNEKWTNSSAREEIESSLSLTTARKPLLSLAVNNDNIVGFAWIILTDKDNIDLNDMPFGADIDERMIGVETVRYFLKLANTKKVVVFREIGIEKEFQFFKGRHMAANLTLPIIEQAIKEGYKILFYWTNPGNSSFKQGLGFNWHPIHFFYKCDRVIMKGGLNELKFYLSGLYNKDRRVIKEMAENRKSYFCL
jgi:hypothetical protein